MKKTFVCILIVFSSFKLFAQKDTLLPKLKRYDNYTEFINKHLEYPMIAMENGWSGRVEFEFVVTHTGCIDSINIISSPNINFSKEVTRVLEKTKCKWIPAQKNGHPTAVRITSFIDFELEKKE